MKRIDVLIKKARNISSGLFPTVALLMEDPDGGYTLRATLWDGTPGGGKILESHHETKEAAISAYNDFLNKHPANESIEPVLIDMVFEGGGADGKEAPSPVHAGRGTGGGDKSGE